MNKIDITKQYKTRSGLPVRIYAVDVKNTDDEIVHGAYFENRSWFVASWNEYGIFNTISTHQNFLDLIEVGKYDHINIDDKVLVWYDESNTKLIHNNEKFKGHFAGLTKDGKPKIWGSGATSFTAKSEKSYIVFDNCEVINE